ncbi:hypothetical protein KEM56_003814 [Ascosphaera pollenicola]|nr:hypothetical protein KEM56_003814 [Ascosphaera pollenicola]
METEIIHKCTYQSIPPFLTGKDVKEARITHSKVIASYNWMQDDGVIAVPGLPPKWTPAVTPQRLPGDRGVYYRDLNAAKWPRYPIEPTVRSLLTVNPEFDTGSLDIVCCGSTLGTLLQFCANYESWSRPATMELELIGNTVFIVRRERYAHETIKGVRGYGNNFLEAYTTWPEDAKGSISHQRVINYQFAGLNIALRYEVDASIEDPARKTSAGDAKSKDKGEYKPQSMTNDILSLLDGMDMINSARQVSTFKEDQMQSDGRVLRVKHMGSSLDHGRQADIKTRAVYNEVDMHEFAPRLWLRQIPFLVIAKHEAGKFHPYNICMQDLKEVTGDWEDENQDVTMKLARLLFWLIEVARRREGSKLRLEITSQGNMEIRSSGRGPRSVLPMDLKKEWSS